MTPCDVTVISTAREPERRIILGFNIDVLSNAETELDKSGVKLFGGDTTYQLVKGHGDHVSEVKRVQQEMIPDKAVHPCRFRILRDHVSRQNNPAVINIEVMSETIKNNVNVVK